MSAPQQQQQTKPIDPAVVSTGEEEGAETGLDAALTTLWLKRFILDGNSFSLGWGG
jgi:hypothetical protein